jgi:hypothetical protein
MATLLAATFCCLLALPQAALADGPITPTATNYLARVTHTPQGIDAKVTNAYLSIWVRVPAHSHVVVKDFVGNSWVRFTPGGVAVNRNSEEYYLSQVPVPALAPVKLTHPPFPPPRWVMVSSDHSFQWRDGRLHALANIALAPGQSYVGSWRIPVTVNGRAGAIRGRIWHHGAPSLVWFWPVLVLLACALAAWRVRSAELDRRLSRALALVLLILVAVGMGAKYLHGSPGISAGGVVLLLITLAILGAVAGRLVSDRWGGPLLLVTAVIALWAGLTLLPVLTHGYALVALPLFVVRVIAATLLGGAISLGLFGVRMLDRVPT